MAHPIVMPSFGMYTAEGTLVGWLHAEGATVTMGQTIAEIETEKAVQELPCPADGILHQTAKVGTLLKVESVLGYVLAPGEAPPDSARPTAPAPASPASAPTPTHTPAAGERPAVRASPIAKRLAAEHGIDLSSLSGTGPGGRIVEADIVAAVERMKAPPPPTTPAVRARIPLDPMRRTIGERLRRSLDSAVALTLTREVEADRLVAARKAASSGRESSIPFDAYFVKLLAAALEEHPELNSTVEERDLIQWADINVGVAVSLPAGLVVPVIRNAGAAPLVKVAAQIRELAARAREGGLRAEDMAGGTCTLTNLGAASVDAFTPVLNPPQSCILGIGRIRPRAVPRETEIVIANTCVLSLTFDHRVTDGAPAARILDTIDRLMNDEHSLAKLAEAS